MNKNKIIAEFHLRPFGQKGWVKGQLVCPKCNRSDKFGVMFVEKSAVTHCFYCSESFPIAKILGDLGRSDLLEFEYEYIGATTLPLLTETKVNVEKKSVTLPLGFKRIEKDDYLEERGFLPWQYEQYKIGVAELDPKTEDKVVFQIFQKGELVGWMGRSRKSKEWHHDNLKRHKEHDEKLVLRYCNSNHDFSKMLGGLDDITPKTHTVILVEGLFDKANIDRLLELNEDEAVKCCFTFGSELSNDQIDLIPKTVELVILMYDDDAIRKMQVAGSRLLSLFEVAVAVIYDPNIDPGNISSTNLYKLLLNVQSFLYFYSHLTHSNLE